ncbi:MAG: SRPBCC family protein [Bacteroidota bacterium]
MLTVTTEVIIHRPIEEVFDFIANMENNPSWQNGMLSCRYTSDPPHVQEATYDQVAKFMGREIVSSFTILEFDRPNKIKGSSPEGSFPITFTRMLEKTEQGTKVSALIEGDPSGFFKLAAPLMKGKVAKSVKEDYLRLKTLLEK